MEGTNTIVTALSGALDTVADQMMEAISAILPVALPVGGAVLVILIGWRIFKRLTK